MNLWFILAARVLSLGAAPSSAALTASSIATSQTPNRGMVALTSNIRLGAYQVLYTAGPNGSRCYAITASNTDAATHNVQWQIWSGSTVMFNVSIAVSANAGLPPVGGGGPTQPLLTPSVTAGFPVDQYGNQYIQLNSGDSIRVAYFSSLTAGSVLGTYAACSDF